MRKPDVVFTVYVCKEFRIDYCAAARADHDKGYWGFHQPDRCPDCCVTFVGYEFWGENGHRQGHDDTDLHNLARSLRYRARQQWRCQDGKIKGYKFKVGADQRYIGQYI